MSYTVTPWVTNHDTKIYGYDEDNSTFMAVPIDPETTAVVMIGNEHSKLHRGGYYSLTVPFTGIATTASGTILIQTGASAYHATIDVFAEAGADLTLREGVALSATASGTALSAYNKNRTSSNAPTLSAFSSPTISGAGTLIASYSIGTSGVPSTRGTLGTDRGRSEWVLKPSTKYYFQIYNVDAGTKRAAVDMQWYED